VFICYTTETCRRMTRCSNSGWRTKKNNILMIFMFIGVIAPWNAGNEQHIFIMLCSRPRHGGALLKAFLGIAEHLNP